MLKKDPATPLSVGFILLQRFTLLPFAAFIDCLRLAADEGDRSRQLHCSWTLMTTDGENATASCGASIAPCVPLQPAGRFDYLVVVGGVQERDEQVDPALAAYLQDAAGQGVPLIGLCTGVFALIQAGLLTGKRCCVSWYHHADLLQRYPGVTPVADRIFVDEGAVITCSGGVAAADVAAHLIERHLGRAWAMKSLHIMLIDEMRHGDHPQPQPVVLTRVEDRLVRRAIDIISQHMGEVIAMDELARRIGTSRRNLERKFRDELGMSPQLFARDLRLRYGMWLLHYSPDNITEIAERCGFADSAHFSRHFRDTFGYPPSQVRKGEKALPNSEVDPYFLHIGAQAS